MLVSDIQRFSLHDGPGIRTTVFFKGCNLACKWCHNPESISPQPQVQFHVGKCIACGRCIEACPNGAHRLEESGSKVFDRSMCVACGRCAAACDAGALAMAGREMTVREVLDELAQDEAFYRNSSGGVTISGGEPLFQARAAASILAGCKEMGLHTAVETNLAWPWQRVELILPHVDLLMVDIKTMDPALHKRWTGKCNAEVLDNVRRLGRTDVAMIVRTPVISSVNAAADEIGAIADFVGPLDNLLYYELLPYHGLGSGKYESLSMRPPGEELACPGPEELVLLADEARKRGIMVCCQSPGASR